VDDIFVVSPWPPGAGELKVPSQLSYSKTPKRLRQFGYDIDAESLILSETKLELEEDAEDRTRIRELKSFADTLYAFTRSRLDDAAAELGGIPKHLSKSAEDIVEDYLKKVAEVVRKDIAERWPNALDQIPIEVVITHPAVSLPPAELHNMAANSPIFRNGLRRPRTKPTALLTQPSRVNYSPRSEASLLFLSPRPVRIIP